MEKQKIKIIIFFLTPIFYLAMFQTQAITETVQPDESIKIVLCAPTSGQPELVKITNPKEPKVFKRYYHARRHKRQVKTAGVKGATIAINGFTLSLPKNTPVFFGVEQVNTLLYTIKITVAEETSETAETPDPLDWSKVYDSLKTLVSSRTNLTGDAKPSEVQNAIKELEDLVKAIETLSKEWDALLYQTETTSFYAGSTAEVNARFAKIQTDAAASTQETLKELIRDNRLVDSEDVPAQPRGTSQEIFDVAAAALQKVNEAYKTSNTQPAKDLPKDLSETSNEIATALRTSTEQLREIESATWTRYDTETRILKDQIKYTCVFEPKDKDSNLKTIEREVTVKGIPKGWVIKFTASPLTVLSGLRDESYVVRLPDMGNANTGSGNSIKAPMTANNPTAEMNMSDNSTSDDETTPDVEINMNEIQRIGAEDIANLSSGGVLVHVSHTKCPILGLSGLLAVDGNKNPQLGIGGSLLFNTAEEHTVAFTSGVIVGKVKRLDGYEAGYKVGVDEFPSGMPPTKLVHRPSWFVAITFNFKLNLFGSKVDITPTN